MVTSVVQLFTVEHVNSTNGDGSVRSASTLVDPGVARFTSSYHQYTHHPGRVDLLCHRHSTAQLHHIITTSGKQASQTSDTRTKMYAGRVACCPLVSHVKYAPRALLTLEKRDGTDGTPDQHITLSTIDAASVIIVSRKPSLEVAPTTVATF